jgi:hypothetical protein
VNNEAPLQTVTHRPLSYGLKPSRVPETDLVAKYLRFQVFTLGMMENQGDRLMARTGGAIATDFNSISSWSLITRNRFPASPDNEFVLILLDDQRWNRGVLERSRLHEPKH